MAAGLVSCTSLSSSSLEEAPAASGLPSLPGHWTAGETWQPVVEPDHHWIESFRAPALTRFTQTVVRQNRELKAAQARVDAAAASARMAGADLFPQAGIQANGLRHKQNFIGLPLPGAAEDTVIAVHNNQFGLSLDVSWEVDLWGRIRNARAAALRDLEASAFERKAMELSLTGQAAKLWFALAESRQQIALTRSTIDLYGKTESVIRQRFESGVEQEGSSMAAQLLLAGAELSNTKEVLQTQLEWSERTTRQLELLAGDYPRGEAGKLATLPALPGKVPTGLPASLLERRPDIAEADRKLAAADARWVEAKLSLLPALRLTGAAGTSSSDIGDILNSDFTIWSLVANAAQPVLQGGRLRANIARTEAQITEARANYEQAALTAFTEVENALAQERYLTRRIAATENTARLSTQAYARAVEEFSSGTGDILTAMSAQQRRFASESQVITLRRMRLDNRVDLYLALGGSFAAVTPGKPKEQQP